MFIHWVLSILITAGILLAHEYVKYRREIRKKK
jgi:hypothetical protein